MAKSMMCSIPSAPCDELLLFIRVGIAQIGVLSHKCAIVEV